MDKTEKLIAKNVFKVFGDDPTTALKLHGEGLDKNTIFDRTGQTIGVSDASFTVYEGEIFVIMGLSGSGKSTLVRLLNRLIEPTSGQILIEGSDIAQMNDAELLELRRTKISMVFQSFALMPHMTVVDNTAFGLELSGASKDDRRARAMDALEQVGLAAWADSYPAELSGGMQQRVGLARGLANDPAILLMDEAFSALDPLIRSEMQDELLKLQEEQQRTIIFISHDLDEAMKIGDRIAIMEGGRVVQVGTPDDILKNPADDYVSSFFRGVNVGSVLTAGDIASKEQVKVIERAEGMGIRAAAERMKTYDRPFAYVIEKSGKYHGVVSVDSIAAELKSKEPKLSNAYIDEVEPIAVDVSLNDIIGTVAASPCGVPVVDDKGCYRGVVSRSLLLETLDQQEAEDV